MKNGKYYLTYRYTNASVEIVVMTGDTQAYNIDLCKMLRMSTKRPWKLDNLEFDMIDVADENGAITVLMENDVIMVTLNIALDDDGILSVDVEWKNTSEEVLCDTMLSIVIPVKVHTTDKIIIPSVCYETGLNNEGNFESKFLCGGGFIAEEHRLPAPFVCINNVKRANGSLFALFSVPSRCTLNENFDNEWSIGIIKEKDNIELVLMSGGVMTNGQKDFISGNDGNNVNYERGYFDFNPGASITKKFEIYECEGVKQTEEFDEVIKRCVELYNPGNNRQTSFNDFLKNKSIALKNRFIENGDFAGYVKKLSTNSEDIHYTSMSDVWTIDNIAAAWCDADNSLRLRMREGIIRARKCVDFFINSSKCKKKGLRQLYFDNNSLKWQYSANGDTVPSHEFGLMVTYLADIILLFKEHCLEVPEAWTDALIDSCDFLCLVRKMTKEGLYPEYWSYDGAIGGSDRTGMGITCVSALAKAYIITGEHHYINVAVKAFIKYYESMILHSKLLVQSKKQNVPELDCDKMEYIYFIKTALDCFEATNEEKYLKTAVPAANILLTYVKMVDYPLKRESKLYKYGFDFRGLSGVSKYIHAMNVKFPAYELKMIGEETNNSIIKNMAEMTVNAMTQLTSTGEGEYGIMAAGEQPDEFYITNWSENRHADEWRGGYGDFNSLSSLVWSFKQVLQLSDTSII